MMYELYVIAQKVPLKINYSNVVLPRRKKVYALLYSMIKSIVY